MTSDPGFEAHPSRDSDARILRFGVFELDPRAGELRRAGRRVRIQPQPLKVLCLLAGRPGEVVTREEIQAEVWPAGTFVDFEQSLNFCIRHIRAALGDNALCPRYVETLPRRGYRWVGGQVERVGQVVERGPWPALVPAAVADDAETPAAEPRSAEDGRDQGVSDDLAPASRLSLISPAASPTARRGTFVAVVIGALGLCSIAVAAWLLLGRGHQSSPPSFQRLTFRRGVVSSARFASQGEVVYGAAWDGRESRLHVTRADSRDTRTLEAAGQVVGVSSTGEVAFIRQGVLARAPLAGGPPKDVLQDVVAADWTGDGAEFAVVRAEQGRYRLEFPVGRKIAEVLRPSRLRLSPDRTHLALAIHPQFDDDRGSVVVYDRDGRQVAASEDWGSLEGLAWPPAGEEVWFTATRAGSDNAVQALSVPGGESRLVLAGTGRLVLHDVAPDGRVLLESATQRSEVLFRRRGDAVERDLSWLDFSAAAALSHDGSRVLFYESGLGGAPDYLTFLRGTDGSPPVRVGSGRACALSPDGHWVLSVDLRRPDRIDMMPTGAGEPRQIRIPGGHEHEMAGFFPSGREVFVTTREPDGRRRTWRVGIDGRDPRPLPMPEGRALFLPTISPDGSLAVTSCPGSKAPCFVPLGGGAPRPVPGGREGWSAIGWDAAGRLYLGARSRSVPAELWRLDPRTARAERLAELAPRDLAGILGITGVVVSGDGEAWAYTVLRRLSDLHVVSDVS